MARNRAYYISIIENYIANIPEPTSMKNIALLSFTKSAAESLLKQVRNCPNVPVKNVVEIFIREMDKASCKSGRGFSAIYSTAVDVGTEILDLMEEMR